MWLSDNETHLHTTLCVPKNTTVSPKKTWSNLLRQLQVFIEDKLNTEDQ